MNPSELSRRKFLSAAVIAATAGCIWNESDPRTVAIGEITAVNHRETSTEIEVTVERAGDIVYDETLPIAGRDGNEVNEHTISEPWMGETDRFEVRASVSDIGSERLDTDYLADVADNNESTDCFPLRVDIRPNELEFWHGTSGCSDV